MATYRIETENGTYEIETDEPSQPKKSMMESAIAGGKAVSGKALEIMTGQSDPQQEALKMSDRGYEQLGELAAEKIGATGHPIVGGMVGGTIANANNFAGAAALLKDRRALAEGVEAVGQGIKSGVKGIGKGVKELGANIIEGKATRRSRALRNQIDDLPLEKVQRESQLEELRKQASAEIETARQNYPQQLYDMSKVEVNEFANMMKSIEPRTKNLDALLKLRDRAKSIAERADSTQRAFINRGIAKIDENIGKLGKEGKDIASAYKKYGEVMSAADDVPDHIMRKKIGLKKQTRELTEKAKREQTIRKVAAGAIGLGGAYGIFK